MNLLNKKNQDRLLDICSKLGKCFECPDEDDKIIDHILDAVREHCYMAHWDYDCGVEIKEPEGTYTFWKDYKTSPTPTSIPAPTWSESPVNMTQMNEYMAAIYGGNTATPSHNTAQTASTEPTIHLDEEVELPPGV